MTSTHVSRGAEDETQPAVFEHDVILITVNRSIAEGRDVYDAVRYAWKLDVDRARKADVILAVEQGFILDAFVADRWLPATAANFPGLTTDLPQRWGFEGREASDEIRALYRMRRVPDEMRKRGAANPIRYASPTVG